MTTKQSNRTKSDVLGILFGTDTLHGCRATKTVLGRIRYRDATVAIKDGDLNDALDALTSELGATGVSLPVAAAIGTDECYFATRPVASGAATASPRALLRESLRSSSVRLDQMAIDVIYWQPDRRTVAGICAAPEDRVESIRTAVSQAGHALQSLVPSAASLIAVAPDSEGGRERKNVLTTRVLLGQTHLLAVMSRGAKPIHWQHLPLPAGDEALGIVAAIRSLETAANACGLDRTPEVVVVHGRSELKTLVDQDWLAASLAGSLRWIDSPALDGNDVARSLADGFLGDHDDGFDLVRQHRDPMQLRHVVPYKEVVAYVVAACVLAAVLWSRLDSVRNEQTVVMTSAPPMVADHTNPKTEKDQLSSRASAVSQFLDRRIRWSQLIGDVMNAIPEGMQLTAVRGTAPMQKRSRRQTKWKPETLVLKAQCALNDDGTLPEALNHLAEDLHQLDSVQSHFQHVELSDLRRTQSQDSGVAGAEFAVIFTAKPKGGG